MIREENFGFTASGDPVYKYIISEGNTEVEIISYGATVVSLHRPNHRGVMTDLVCGFATLGEYEANSDYMGATVGRTCGRIDRGRFVLENKSYSLNCNQTDVHLHGGAFGFDKKVWRSEPVGENGVSMTYISPDGEEGYPGRLVARALFYVTRSGGFNIVYSAYSDKTTLCDMTSHMYFNMDGEDTSDARTNLIRIYSHTITPPNVRLVPEGKVKSVSDTPFDFLVFKEMGKDIFKEDPQLSVTGGYDHNYVADKKSGSFSALAEAIGKKSRIRMRVESNADCMQFYSGNLLNGMKGKSGRPYPKWSAFCFEPQICPNAINIEGFLAPVLVKGSKYEKRIRYTFSTERILVDNNAYAKL